MVDQKFKSIIILGVYLLSIVMIGFFAFEEGYYSGLKTLCPSGNLNSYPEGVIRCESPFNSSGELFLEVNYFG